MRRIAMLLLLLTVVSSPPLRAQHPEIHSEHFLHGYPTGTPTTNDLVIRDIYALSSNDARKLADWVAYRLDHRTVAGPPIERRWRDDPWLDDDETLEPEDYFAAHDSLDTDRGHQAPLAAFRGEVEADQTNYLSNITPQKSELNRGPWENLEARIRRLASVDTLWVMTGPLYERSMPALPQADEPHEVPSGYWKIVARRGGTDAPSVVSFAFDQETEGGEDYCTRRTTVDEVEARSGLDFFRELADPVEDNFEAADGSPELAADLGC